MRIFIEVRGELRRTVDYVRGVRLRTKDGEISHDFPPQNNNNQAIFAIRAREIWPIQQKAVIFVQKFRTTTNTIHTTIEL
jgi:hypothetical protein